MKNNRKGNSLDWLKKLDGNIVIDINDPSVSDKIDAAIQLQEATLKLKEIDPQVFQKLITI